VSTPTVVDEIKLKAPGWSRTGSRSILAQMNRAQNFLFSKSCLKSIYVDPLTGDYPYLETQATIMDYEVPDVDVEVDPDVGAVPLRIAKVIEVFSENVNLSDYGLTNLDGKFSSIIGNKIRWDFTPRPALQDKRARILLPFDPGDTTDKFMIQCLIEPLQLTAESIPLMVEQDEEDLIIEGALAFIEYYDYGRSDRLNNFKYKLASEFWTKYNGVETLRKSAGTPRRKF
jgi:hypothetical protein